MSGDSYQYLSFNIKVLKWLNIWDDGASDKPKWKQWKSYSIFVATLPTAIPIATECIFTFTDNVDMAIQLQSVLATTCILGLFYMAFGCLRNSNNIKQLVLDLDTFRSYSDLDLVAVDRQATFYSKGLLCYSIVGTLTYAFMPLLSLEYCKLHKSRAMLKHGIPCGVITRFRLPFGYDWSPAFEVSVLHVAFVAGLTTVVIVNTTMLICGLLAHVCAQLEELETFIRKMNGLCGRKVVQELRFIVKYHNAIIAYTKRINEAFGNQLIIYITLTSLLMSILVFEVLKLENVAEVLRFSLHLIGWILLLQFVCSYGQVLIDKSTSVSSAAYFISWYNFPVAAQRDLFMIIIRGRRPLTLNAANFGTFSAATFLKVLSTSYSYFTLLINVK